MKSIRTKLLVGFGIILVLVLIMSAITIYNTNNANKLSEKMIMKDMEELLLYEELRFNVADRIAVTRGYLLYGDIELKEKFYSYMEQSKEIEEQLLSYSSQANLAKTTEIVEKNSAWGDYTDQQVYGTYETDRELANELNKDAREEAEELMSLLQVQVEDKNKLVHDMGDNILLNGKVTNTSNLVVTAIVLIASVIIALVVAKIIINPILVVVTRLQEVAKGDFSGDEIITKSKDEVGLLTNTMNDMVKGLRNLIERVRYTSEQVAASSEQLTASAEETSKATEQITTAVQEVSVGSEKQVDSINKTSEIVTEISKGMDQVAISITSVADLSIETNTKSAEGNEVVGRTIKQMSDVKEQVKNTSLVVNALGTKSSEIGQIVELITEIANQTNLLALNAAIEAARAGEHGKGFAVVADEVRKLAEQSGDAAGQISRLIGEIQTESIRAVDSMDAGSKSVEDGLQMVHQTGNSFNEIAKMIEDISSQSQEVSAIVEQVNAGSEEMVQTIETVANVSEQSAANAQNVAASTEEQLGSMEEITASAESLSQMAEELQDLVKRFKI
ncbi:methyl-accepting chemotaxis protein [Aquibacillus rhizosphaerae]|uniref:Methyl-accepting chemotaxis protein n=1 Tax=Aquibacillus rhizosphaerae TaxID=3051431 RepID=A0ABT7LBH0_9BACI|nr:methyl-accepting chemotaxis protein [Aquibacillus sp. LR5S19]MDL4843211.1 methyl-accepting chemotaxis protein [Aquibacillus sp. LR5S19]